MTESEYGGIRICRNVQNYVLTDTASSQNTRMWDVNESLWGRKADCQQETWNPVHVHRSLLKQPGTE